jgi:dTDP-4-dehydrorhamnose 3,5-epimerase
MEVVELDLSGCFELVPKVFEDARGSFTKVVQRSVFTELGLEADFTEQYHTVSHRGVLRGMHFQLPPSDHVKVVYCTNGEIIDAVVDLRRGSPTEGQNITRRLSAANSRMIYLARGVAHGFYTLSETATVHYMVTSEYDPARDTGVLWSSCGIDWPSAQPATSERDRSFVTLREFESPFDFGGTGA